MKKRLLILFLFLSNFAVAQSDALGNGKSAKDSVLYTNLKNSFKKHRITKELYNFLFRDVYNKTAAGEVKAIEINPFLPYKDKIIGKIMIKSLDIFGPTVYDTARKGNGIERFTSHTFHRNTQEDVVRRSYLLFKEGDKVNPKLMEDNERILRQNRIIHDARIIIIPRQDITWMVDVEVIIQDIFSINVGVDFSSTQKFALSVEDINFLGRGHSFKNYVKIDSNDPIQKVQVGSQYTIPYIGKTFITGQAELILDRDLHRQAVRFYRPFLTTETKYAGAFEAGHSTLRDLKRLIINNKDSLIVNNVSFYYYDTWLGRSFKIPTKENKNARLIVAARISEYNYTHRPIVTKDTNTIYWNRRSFLFSLGYSTRQYRRDLLIYGFGRTEDVPIGTLLSLTSGWENTEFGRQGYTGIQYAKGFYIPNNNGYFYGLINLGSYLKNAKIVKGVFSTQGNYISPLLRFKNHHFRHFITLKFTRGFNRDPLEYLNISNTEGITGINSDYLRGDKRLTLDLESVIFSPKTIVGFRVATFVFGAFGLVSLHNVPLSNSPIYQGYGIGFRFRNENLTFNTFQIRLGYYPNIPDLSAKFKTDFNGVQPLRLRDFDITAPSVIPLR